MKSLHRRMAAGLFVLLLASCSFAGSQSRRPVEELLTPAVVPTRPAGELAPPAPPSVMRGAALYATKCAACHGDTGQADGARAAQVRAQGSLVPRLANPDLQRAATPRAWFDLVTNGRIERLMPGFAGSLSAQDRWDVLSYVWALGVMTDSLQTGQPLYMQQCQACHGAQGEGDGPEAGAAMASFADPTWLAETSLSQMAIDMARGDPHKTVQLDDAQRYAVADYIRTFGYEYADPADVRVSANTGDGVLRYRAVNLTPGGATATDLPVTLRVYGPDSEVLSRTAPLDSTGVVTFASLPVQPDYFYQSEVIYQGARFFAAPVQFTDTRIISNMLPIHEVTTDPGVISISELHVFVQSAGEGMASIVEFYLFDNASDRAYVSQPGQAGQSRSLRVSLPPDATNLRFDGPGIGSRFVQSGTLIYDLDAVGPGARSSSITMIYDVPYDGSRDFDRQVFYPVKRWDVLAPEGELRAPDLVDKGLQQTASGNIRLFEPAQLDVAAGGSVRFELAGQPRGAPAPGEDARAIGVGLVAIAVALGLGYFVLRRSRRAVSDEAVLAVERQKLLKAIAALDGQREAGKVNEADYQKKRAGLKDQLRDIWE